jgi:hypothetical protein
MLTMFIDIICFKKRQRSISQQSEASSPLVLNEIDNIDYEVHMAVCTVAMCTVAVCTVAVCTMAVFTVAVCTVAVCAVAVCIVDVCTVAVCTVAVCTVAVCTVAVCTLSHTLSLILLELHKSDNFENSKADLV